MIIAPTPMQRDIKDQTEVRKAFNDLAQSINTQIIKELVDPIIFNSASVETYTFSVSIPSPIKNIPYQFVNIGAGVVTLVFDSSGNDPTLSQNCSASFIYNGDTWVFTSPIGGSNANGSWIKYPDGTMVEYGSGPATASSTLDANGFGSTAGNIYYGNATVTFSIAFIAEPATSVGRDAGSSGGRVFVEQATTNTGITIRAWAPTSGTNCTATWIAIGRWI